MMSRYCEQCGAELSDDAKFCEECGYKIEEQENKSDVRKKTNKKVRKKGVIAIVVISIAVIGILSVAGVIEFGRKKITIEEFCEKYNEEVVGAGGQTLLQEAIDKERVKSMGAAYLQHSNPYMIPEVTLEKTTEIDNYNYDEYDVYSYYVFNKVVEATDGRLRIDLLTKKDSNIIYEMTAKFQEEEFSFANSFVKLSVPSFGTEPNDYPTMYEELKDCWRPSRYIDGAIISLVYEGGTFYLTITFEDEKYYEEHWLENENPTIVQEKSIDYEEQENGQYEKNIDESKEDEAMVISENTEMGDEEYAEANIDVNSEYIFPDSNSSYLDKNYLYSFSLNDLELGRNEIFARHGRIFKDERIRNYFESKSWYQGTISPEEYDANMDIRLNEYEKANVEMIKEIEAIKNQQGQP